MTAQQGFGLVLIAPLVLSICGMAIIAIQDFVHQEGIFGALWALTIISGVFGILVLGGVFK